MGFLADFTVELGAEIKKPYPKLHFCQLFAFLTKKFFLAIFRPLFTARFREIWEICEFWSNLVTFSQIGSNSVKFS